MCTYIGRGLTVKLDKCSLRTPSWEKYNRLQGRIQDVPLGAQPPWGALTSDMGAFRQKIYVKMKESDLVGGQRKVLYADPPLV